MKGRKKQTNSNSLVSLVAVLAIVFGIILAIGNKPIDTVKGLVCSSAGENFVNLSWKPVNKADGYIIYQKDSSTGDYKEIMKYDKNDVTEHHVKTLEQAVRYDFSVNAYKESGKKIRESKKTAELSVYTLPSAVELNYVKYIEKGLAEVSWSKNEKAEGYEVQYAADAKFDDAKKIDAEKNDTIVTVNELEYESGYFFRVRSFFTADEEKIFSEWSKTEELMSYEDFEKLPKVDPNKPMIALTFDDGPGYNSASDRILDVLEKYNARATFFMVGTNAASHPKNLKRKVELGCELGNHTYDHAHYGENVTANDIKKCSEEIYKACGKYPTCFRSPGGNTTDAIKNECISESMALYYWTIDTNDWKSRDADKVYKHVMNYAGDGDIVLMHEIYGSTADAVEKMVPELIAQGYQLVTVSELMQAKTGSAAVPGTEYFTANRVKN